MSAFLCADDTFDLIATAAVIFADRYGLETMRRPALDAPDYQTAKSDGCLLDALGLVDPANVAAVLYAENMRSLKVRYPDSWQEFTTNDDGEPFAPYQFTPVPEADLDPVIVLKSIRCLRYQSCEAQDYERTIAAKLLNEIEDHTISKLPGYDAAPWGWTRKDNVTHA